MNSSNLNRRRFLNYTLGAGLSVGFLAGCSLPVIPKRPQPELEQAMGWIRYEAGQYRLTLPRIELGQNVTTAMKQIACDELEIDWENLSVVAQATDRIERVKSTVGSESIKDFAEPLAQACATLRDAVRTGKSASEIEPQIRPLSTLKSFTKTGQYVGQTAPLEGAHSIVTGQPIYAADMHKEGMVYGRIARSPYACDLESAPLSWERDKAERVPGFVALIDQKDLIHGRSKGLGVVAETPGALNRIEEVLNIRWRVADDVPGNIETLSDVDMKLRDGNLPNSLRDDDLQTTDPWTIDLRVDITAAAHGAIEPRVALAYEEDGILHLWTGSQDIFYVKDVLLKHTGLDEGQICVHACRVGGGFGGKTLCFAELEAVQLSLAVKRPVKVQWTREQEYAQAFHRPPSSHRIKARVENGQVTDWCHGFTSGHILFTNAGLPSWLQAATDFVGDKGVARGALPPYRLGRTKVEYDLVRYPFFTGPWRGLGAAPNSFAIEVAMNECAFSTGLDPVVFRQAHIEDDRLNKVLLSVAQLAQWDATNIKGRGVACGIYKDMSYVAVVADVEQNDDGTFKVRKLWCVHDCGPVVNPDQVRSQCEGNLLWGLSMVLHDTLTFEGGNMSASLFDEAPIPRMADCPEMEVYLVEGGEVPTGAGETAIVASGAAIANAIRTYQDGPVSRLPVA